MGDINLDYQKWQSPERSLSCLVEQVKQFQADSAMLQTVEEPTQFATNGQTLLWSLTDHCYESNLHAFCKPQVQAVGSSDHLGVSVSKVTRVPLVKPITIKKRVYKHFNDDRFCLDMMLNYTNG